MQLMLAQPNGLARWMPPIWFLGLYEQILSGASAPAFAAPMAHYAFRATAMAATTVAFTYPLAWARMRRMAIEGASGRRAQPARWLTWLTHRVIPNPGERAVFHFIGQTIARNTQYQVFLALYCGTGLGLAISCATTFQTTGAIHPMLSTEGLHALMPLLVFWITAGLHNAFASPVNLRAGWIFRITGVNLLDCTAAARKWALLCAFAVTTCILAALCIAHWNLRSLLVQLVCGLSLSVLLTDAFFSFQHGVPFNQPRMPGRANFPLMLTLYIGILPVFIYGVMYLEQRLEKNLLKLIALALTVVAMHIAFAAVHAQPQQPEEELEGYEGEFQLLGLS